MPIRIDTNYTLAAQASQDKGITTGPKASFQDKDVYLYHSLFHNRTELWFIENGTLNTIIYQICRLLGRITVDSKKIKDYATTDLRARKIVYEQNAAEKVKEQEGYFKTVEGQIKLIAYMLENKVSDFQSGDKYDLAKVRTALKEAKAPPKEKEDAKRANELRAKLSDDSKKRDLMKVDAKYHRTMIAELTRDLAKATKGFNLEEFYCLQAAAKANEATQEITANAAKLTDEINAKKEAESKLANVLAEKQKLETDKDAKIAELEKKEAEANDKIAKLEQDLAAAKAKTAADTQQAFEAQLVKLYQEAKGLFEAAQSADKDSDDKIRAARDQVADAKQKLADAEALIKALKAVTDTDLLQKREATDQEKPANDAIGAAEQALANKKEIEAAVKQAQEGAKAAKEAAEAAEAAAVEAEKLKEAAVTKTHSSEINLQLIEDEVNAANDAVKKAEGGRETAEKASNAESTITNKKLLSMASEEKTKVLDALTAAQDDKKKAEDAKERAEKAMTEARTKSNELRQQETTDGQSALTETNKLKKLVNDEEGKAEQARREAVKLKEKAENKATSKDAEANVSKVEAQRDAALNAAKEAEKQAKAAEEEAKKANNTASATAAKAAAKEATQSAEQARAHAEAAQKALDETNAAVATKKQTEADEAAKVDRQAKEAATSATTTAFNQAKEAGIQATKAETAKTNAEKAKEEAAKVDTSAAVQVQLTVAQSQVEPARQAFEAAKAAAEAAEQAVSGIRDGYKGNSQTLIDQANAHCNTAKAHVDAVTNAVKEIQMIQASALAYEEIEKIINGLKVNFEKPGKGKNSGVVDIESSARHELERLIDKEAVTKAAKKGDQEPSADEVSATAKGIKNKIKEKKQKLEALKDTLTVELSKAKTAHSKVDDTTLFKAKADYEIQRMVFWMQSLTTEDCGGKAGYIGQLSFLLSEAESILPKYKTSGEYYLSFVAGEVNPAEVDSAPGSAAPSAHTTPTHSSSGRLRAEEQKKKAQQLGRELQKKLQQQNGAQSSANAGTGATGDDSDDAAK